MAIVEEYWSGVLQRLQAEVESLNRLIQHSGEMGRENEQSLARLLARLVPSRYGVGSGLLFDRHDAQSRQLDVIVFEESDEPAILAQTTQVLFPVENARAVVEVKTTADKDEVDDDGKKNASVKALQSTTSPAPTTGLLAYKAAVQPDTLAGHIRNLEYSASGDVRPDLFCVLATGLVGGKSELFGHTAGNYVAGITQLQLRDASGARIAGSRDPAGSSTDAFELRGGQRYPVLSLGGEGFLVEPSRALLLFCDALLNALAAARGTQSVMTQYVTSVARDVIEIPA